MTVTHGACGKEWIGTNRSHCGACHETFSSESAADLHRKGEFGKDRRCVPPEEVGLVAREKSWGILWGHPSPDNPFWK